MAFRPLSVVALALLVSVWGCSGKASMKPATGKGSGGSSAQASNGHENAGSSSSTGGSGGGKASQNQTGKGTSSGGSGGSGNMTASSGGTGGMKSDTSTSTGGAADDGPPPPPGPPGCGLDNAAFCDTFDKASPGGNAGDLDDSIWSGARMTTATAASQGALNVWGASGPGTACGKSSAGRVPPNDMFFCAGGPTASMHFNDLYNDGGGFTVHSWRIRQPFDFANRTGVIVFDAAAKSQIPGGHGFWFNVFISSDPGPAPYQLGEGVALYVKAGVGIEFEAGNGSGTDGQCRRDGTENSVSQIYIEKDYDIVDAVGFTDSNFGNDKTRGQGNSLCYKTADEQMNHIEIHISQTQIEVYASDAGQPDTFRLVAIATGLDIPFSRGYVSFQQTHYNARKCTAVFANLPQCVDCENTCPSLPPWTNYQMDNVGFDGPKFSTPRAYEVPDNNHMSNNNDTTKSVMVLPDGTQITDITFPDPQVHTGYELTVDQKNPGIMPIHGKTDVQPIVLKDVDLKDAKDAVLTMNAWHACAPIQYRFNGGTWRTYMPPPALASDNHKTFDCQQATTRALPVSLDDLKQGDNTLDMYNMATNLDAERAIIANIELTVNPK